MGKNNKSGGVLNNHIGKSTEIMERDRIGMWGHGDNVIPGKTSGIDRIKNPGLNKVSYFK